MHQCHVQPTCSAGCSPVVPAYLPLQPILTLRCSIHQFAAYIAAVAAYLLGRLSTCGASLSAVRKAPVMLANQSLQSHCACAHTRLLFTSEMLPTCLAGCPRVVLACLLVLRCHLT
jgi:hypothetical protein